MHILRRGYAIVTIFFVITSIFLIGIITVRLCSFKKNITSQQYHYWRDYYACEGCLEYVFATFCDNTAILHQHISLHQEGTTFTIHINKKRISRDIAVLDGVITQKDQKKASWQLILEKDNSTWNIVERKIILFLDDSR